MYLDKPKEHGWADIIEDLPGETRAITPIFKNFLPSAAVISSNPEERRLQIRKAIERIKNTQHPSEPLYVQSLREAGKAGASAVLPSLIVTALVNALGARGFRKTLPSGKKVFQSPIAPGESLGKLFNSAEARSHFVKDVLTEGAYGPAIAALHGGAVPFLSKHTNVSDKALEEAAQILEKQPYITSLPAAEVLSTIKENKNSSPVLDKVKNIASGAGIGALLGMLQGGLLPSAFNSVKRVGGNLFSRGAARKPLLSGASEAFKENLVRDLRSSAGWGAAAGAISGGLVNNFPNIKPPVQTSPEDVALEEKQRATPTVNA
jgi:hypothetical protein